MATLTPNERAAVAYLRKEIRAARVPEQRRVDAKVLAVRDDMLTFFSRCLDVAILLMKGEQQ